MDKPNVTADMKVIRNALDAVTEVVGNAVNAILDYPVEFGLPNRELTEAEEEQLEEFVFDLITRGEAEWHDLDDDEPCIHPNVFSSSNDPEATVLCATCNTRVKNRDL